MAYDPYADQRENPTVANIVKENLNPVGLLKFQYMYNPGTWSGTKGIWVPGASGKDIASAYRRTVRAFRRSEDGGILKGLGTAGKEAWGVSTTSRRVLGQGGRTLSGTSAKGIDILQRRLYREQFRKTMYKTAIKGYKSAGIEVTESMMKQMSKEFALKVKNFMKMTPEERLEDPVTKALMDEGRLRVMPSSIKLTTEATNGLYKAPASAFTKNAVKWGIRGMKVVNYAMIAFTLWDMTKMIGEPVGRYLVENVNRVSNQFANRYAPEMGGQIALSYMSTGAATERQRAVQAISRSYINGRSALGNEAELMHDY